MSELNESKRTLPAESIDPEKEIPAAGPAAEQTLRTAQAPEAAPAAEAGARQAEAPAQQKDQTPAPKEGEILSRKRRMALVAYLAVLFAVAFLLVALSLVVENRQLQSSSAKNAANLNGRIAELQRQYDSLKEQADAQQAQIADLEQQSQEKDAAAEALADSLEQTRAELKKLEEEKAKLSQAAEDAAQRTRDAIEAHELLYAAKAADEAGDLEQLQELLSRLEPMKELLSPTALEIYESLIPA